ncbi:MAG: hypothetical protein RI957_1057 [Verrucomicrobiota bacterium]|jgi:hypothetical protein
MKRDSSGFILILGLGIIAVPTGMVASALQKARKEEELHPDREKFDDDE